MPGILYVVATPIGNLEDVTLRALRILREVSVIAAEDTRRTSRLLQHYSIPTSTTSLHEHNEFDKAPRLIERLRSGASIALVSDAGTPGVSDPGSRLVSLAHSSGIPVQPVPGPSAVTAIVSASGLGSDGFTFVGFPPSRSSRRRALLKELAGHPFAIVMYEAPHRIRATLIDIAELMGDRPVAIGRELTKAHEQLAVRPISDWVKEPPRDLGEIVLAIGRAERGADQVAGSSSPSEMAASFDQLTNSGGISRREALRRTANRYGVSVRAVYQAVEQSRKLVK